MNTKPALLQNRARKVLDTPRNSAISSRLLKSEHLELRNAGVTASSARAALEALAVLQATDDPSMTREGSAQRYRLKLATAGVKVKESLLRAMDGLVGLDKKLRLKAEIQAGLHQPQSENSAIEIRTMLRSLPQNERDELLRQAVEGGPQGALILRAVRDAANPMLIGGTSVPVETMISQSLQIANPDLAEQLGQIESASSLLLYEADEFHTGSESLRDHQAETLADLQAVALAGAESDLANL